MKKILQRDKQKKEMVVNVLRENGRPLDANGIHKALIDKEIMGVSTKEISWLIKLQCPDVKREMEKGRYIYFIQGITSDE